MPTSRRIQQVTGGSAAAIIIAAATLLIEEKVDKSDNRTPAIAETARLVALEQRVENVEFTLRMLHVAECLRSEATPIIYAQIGCRSVMGR
jgi:hypothetical protein